MPLSDGAFRTSLHVIGMPLGIDDNVVCPGLLDRVAAAFEACRAGFAVCGLLLLCLLGSALLLLLRGGRVLPTTLRARGSCSRSSACPRIAADHFTDDRTPRGTANAGARCRTRCRRGRLGGRLLRWFRRIESGLVHRPDMALAFVFLLLLRRLPFRRIYELLRATSRCEPQRKHGDRPTDRTIHGHSQWLPPKNTANRATIALQGKTGERTSSRRMAPQPLFFNATWWCSWGSTLDLDHMTLSIQRFCLATARLSLLHCAGSLHNATLRCSHWLPDCGSPTWL